MSELALQIIAENKKSKAKTLDLGNCGLTEIPAEALECEWIEELILGAEHLEPVVTKAKEQKVSQLKKENLKGSGLD